VWPFHVLQEDEPMSGLIQNIIQDPELALLYEPSLLVSDSQRRFSCLRDAILEQLKPRDFIEHMWVAEFIAGEWESWRLRRYKSLIVTAARHQAVHNLLGMVLETDTRYDIDDLAERYFTTKIVRRKVERILRDFGLSEANIDAEACRCSISDLAGIDRRLAELALRHDKILQRLEDNRAGLARPTQLEQCGDGE
jgi:hypothetical protein